METVEIVWLKDKPSLSQIYSSGPEFCFVSEKNQQCHPFVMCKDFLNDAIYGCLHNKSASIYGFTYNTSSPPISFEKTRLAYTNSSDPKLSEKIPGILDFINQVAKKLHLKRTSVKQISNPESKYKKSGIYLFESTPMWMNSPPLISMYSLFLRVGSVHTVGDTFSKTIEDIISDKKKAYQKNDKSYLASAAKGIDDILKHGYRKFFFKDTKKNFPEKKSIGSIHDAFGIVGFSHDNGMKYWSKKRKEAKEGKKVEVKTDSLVVPVIVDPSHEPKEYVKSN